MIRRARDTHAPTADPSGGSGGREGADAQPRPVALAAARSVVAPLFSPLAHDIRAGLNGITLWTHVLERGSDDSAARGLQGIRRAVVEQSELAQQLSDFGRALSATPDEMQQRMDVVALVRQASAEAAGDAVAREISVQLEVAAGSLWLTGPERLVRLLVQLLLRDALMVSPQAGSIRIRLAETEGRALIEFAVAPPTTVDDQTMIAPRHTLRRALVALAAYLFDGALELRVDADYERLTLNIPTALAVR